MRKYLPILLLFVACNSSYEKANPITVSDKPLTDSISLIVDSLKEWTEDISSVSSYAIKAQARIKDLEERKALTQAQVENEPTYLSMMRSEDYKPVDDKDKEIYRLTQKIREYEREIAKLKNRLFYDSMSKVSQNYDVVPELKPDDKSLIITLNKKLRGDGDISEQGVSV